MKEFPMADLSIPLEINPEKNLSRYLQAIRKFPMLDPEDEHSLAKRWRDHHDGQAGQKLVTSHTCAWWLKSQWDSGVTACPWASLFQRATWA